MTTSYCKAALPIAAMSAAFLTLFAAAAPPAQARGDARVQQSDNSVQDYPNVTIRVIKAQTMTITTSDGKGTLILDKAACSYLGDVQRCLLASASLRQGGVRRDLDFNQGTVYVNLTGMKQPLPNTSAALAPSGVLVAIRSKAGTYITVTGTIDELIK